MRIKLARMKGIPTPGRSRAFPSGFPNGHPCCAGTSPTGNVALRLPGARFLYMSYYQRGVVLATEGL